MIAGVPGDHVNYGPQLARYQGVSIESLMKEAEDRAITLGHRLAAWEADGKYSRVAWCSECGLAAGIDTTYPDDQVFGSTVRVLCERKGTAPYWDKKVYPDYEEELR